MSKEIKENKPERAALRIAKWYSPEYQASLSVNTDAIKNSRGFYDFDIYQLVEYTPHYEILHFWREAEKRVLIFFTSIFVFFLVGSIFNFLEPLMRFMAHTFIAPLKPLVVYGANNQGLINLIEFFSPIFTGGILLIGLFIAYMIISSGWRATHIALTQKGIYLIRKTFSAHGDYHIVDKLQWSFIQDVNLERPKVKKSVKDFVIKLTDVTGKEMKIRYGDVFIPDHRNFFLMSICNNVDTFDHSDLETLKPPDEKISYTDLWLKELSAPPKRDKLRPLEGGAILHGGKYRVIGKIGIGGQATVYLANSTTSSGDEIVLKEFVLPIFPDPRVRRQSAERFQEEANLLSRLNHNQIVDFVEIFIEDHRLYMAMEKVEGQTLEDLIESFGPQPSGYVRDLMLSMAEILKYLHSQNPPVIHRDFTPDNIILEPEGKLKLIDFSVAMEIKNDITGSVVGKMNYIAPEQFRGKATIQSDIYSLGACAFYLLTGQLPEAISKANPLAVNPAVSEDLNTIVKRATHPDIEKRYQNVEMLIRDLKDFRVD